MLALIIFGTKDELEPIGPVNLRCPNCGRTPTTLCQVQRKATVYFIPLFGMGGKSYALACDNCGLRTQLDQQLGEQLHRSLSGGTAPQPRYNPGASPAPSGQIPPDPPYTPDQRTTALPASPLPWQPRTETSATRQFASDSPRCARCGSEVAPDARYCETCGAPVAQTAPAPLRTCPNCGHTQTRGQFCNNCGSRLPN